MCGPILLALAIAAAAIAFGLLYVIAAIALGIMFSGILVAILFYILHFTFECLVI